MGTREERGITETAHVVIDRAAAVHAPHNFDAVRAAIVHVHFCVHVLRHTDEDSVAHAAQAQRGGTEALIQQTGERLLYRKMMMRVVMPSCNKRQVTYPLNPDSMYSAALCILDWPL